MVVNRVEVPYSYQTVRKKPHLDLAAFCILRAESTNVVKIMCITPAKLTE